MEAHLRSSTQPKAPAADIARGVFESIFSGNLQPLGEHPGLAALREHFPPLLAAFPDFRAELKQQLVDGDRVVLHWVFRGTHRGALYGIEPTAKEVQFQNISISRVENGKIVQYNSEVGWLALFRQLGVMERLRG